MATTFKRLPTDVAARCARLGHVLSVPRGAVLAAQGREASRCYYVRTGYARVTTISHGGHDVLVAYMGPRDLIGHSAAVNCEDRYLATTVAAEPMTLIEWDRDVALRLARQFPDVHARLEALLVRNLKVLMTRLHTVSDGSVPQRLARALLELASRHGRRDATGIRIEPPVTREDLAGLTGTTLFTASRVVAAWQRQGLLSSSRGHVHLTNESRLRALAEGER
jgi:CRP/FNR family transcriptional regulator, nitrogen oxide reductase regulator